MGFWSAVGSAAKGAVDKMAEMNEKANELAEEYREKSDDFLKEKYRNGSIVQKMASSKVLKERGYGNQG
jgi:hypothetical protein